MKNPGLRFSLAPSSTLLWLAAAALGLAAGCSSSSSTTSPGGTGGTGGEGAGGAGGSGGMGGDGGGTGGDGGTGGGCAVGETDCSGECVHTGTDTQNCGRCGVACAADQTCVAGVCDGGCGSGLLQCGAACIDPVTDSGNCGGCGIACGPIHNCQAGSCACSVAANQNIGSTVPQIVNGTTAGAASSFSPSCAPGSASERVISFTAPSPGVYLFDSAGSAYNTVISVLDAAGCTELACDAAPRGTARVLADLGADQTVFIVVDGAPGTSGTFSLSVSLSTTPSNCPAGTFGPTVPHTITGSTTGRLNSVTAPCNVSISPDAGYTFTAPAAGDYIFDTFGSEFDTVLHLHNATCTGASLGCNDEGDPAVEGPSEVTVTLAAGQTIVVVVDGYNGTSGAFSLNVHRFVPPPPCDDLAVCGDSGSGCSACALERSCRDELSACQNSDECADFISCYRTCGDAACRAACETAAPTGAALYHAIERCIFCGECPISCASAGFTCP